MRTPTPCARTLLRQARALVVPAVLAVVPQGPAAAHAITHDATPVVQEIDGALYIVERGTVIPVPAEAEAALRAFLTGGGGDGVRSLEVGRTIVADGGSGYHGNTGKP